MKKMLYVLLPVAAAASFWLAVTKSEAKTIEGIAAKDTRMQNRVAGIRQLLKSDLKYNQDIAFLADMKIKSGKNRLFIYDLKKDSIIDRGLVAHGSGSETGVYGKLTFSNTPNSLATSLGKYYIGKSYNGQFGKAYKLYGLDRTNSKAFERAIVLHKFSTMPDKEQEQPACNSFGCPMVSEKYYERLQWYIDQSEKPIILDIYY